MPVGLLAGISNLKTTCAELSSARQYSMLLYPIKYRSKLKTFVGEVPVIKDFQPTTDSVVAATREWERAKITNDFSKFDKKTMRTLCSIQDIVKDPIFISLAESPETIFNSRMLRLLIPTYHALWHRHPEHLRLQHAILEKLFKYSGNNRAVNTWKEQRSRLIEEDAGHLIGAEIAQELVPFEALRAKYYLELGANNLVQEAKDIAAINLTTRITSSTNLNSPSWEYLLKNLLIPKQISSATQSNIVGQLIKAIHSRLSAPEWQNARNQIKDFLLENSGLGDPRISPVNWAGINQDAVDMVIAWLAEEDIEFFFKLIIRDDPHSRKGFWLKYINSIRASRVVIGPDDHYRHARELKELKNKGRSYATFPSSPTSAFILDFGKYVVIEFSGVGNACYIYTKNTFSANYKSLYQDTFQIERLKNQSTAEHRQIHSVRWMVDLRTKLAQLGIRPSR